jgi:hypothetical protein
VTVGSGSGHQKTWISDPSAGGVAAGTANVGGFVTGDGVGTGRAVNFVSAAIAGFFFAIRFDAAGAIRAITGAIGAGLGPINQTYQRCSMAFRALKSPFPFTGRGSV